MGYSTLFSDKCLFSLEMSWPHIDPFNYNSCWYMVLFCFWGPHFKTLNLPSHSVKHVLIDCPTETRLRNQQRMGLNHLGDFSKKNLFFLPKRIWGSNKAANICGGRDIFCCDCSLFGIGKSVPF